MRSVMGYEYDNLSDVDGDFSAFVPPGRVKLGGIIHPDTGDEVGGAAYHKVPSGAEVIALGATNFAYALDGFASPWKSEDKNAQRMIENALRRWTAGAPIPSSVDPPAGEVEGGDAGPNAGNASSDSGCSLGSHPSPRGGALLSLLVAAVAAAAHFSRRRPSESSIESEASPRRAPRHRARARSLRS